MKKIIILFITVFFISCLGSKKIIENKTTKKTDTKEVVKKDSITSVETNKAINDNLSLNVSKVETDDKKFNDAVNKEVDRILSSINASKKSGNNSYSVKYDKNKRKLDVNVNIGETSNSNTNVNSDKDKESSSEEFTFESFYKKVTTLPWYLWAGLVFILLPRILKMFSPHLALMNQARDSIRKPRDD